ncbi:ESF2 Pre-rRNA-processing protein ESF2 [Candida maltosa Xu316]
MKAKNSTLFGRSRDDDNSDDESDRSIEDEDNEEEEEEDDVDHEDDDLLAEEDETPALPETKVSKKLKKLTSEELAKEQKRIKRTGVCYLSKIPPYMKPAKLRSVMERFGAIDRLFLKPEDPTTYHKRVKYGGNKKKNFTEGWIEFVNKKDAKLCAATLNGNKLGGKKTSYYYDDIINIKYLSGFKWVDLTQQIAKENEARQARLAMELSQQQKLNKAFVANVEKSRLITNIQKKRKSGEDDTIRREFKQRKVTTSRADDGPELKKSKTPTNGKLDDLLSKVF